MLEGIRQQPKFEKLNFSEFVCEIIQEGICVKFRDENYV